LVCRKEKRRTNESSCSRTGHCPKTGNENFDIEFQGDGSKPLYYTANGVDFRLLIKDFAKEFSTRVEMKQVGFRQDSFRKSVLVEENYVATWLTDFRSVNTSAALPATFIEPAKLAGQN
jgi:cell fate regulator YaaT (PSP1 superfamily)